MLQLYLLGEKKYIIEHYLNSSINGTKKVYHIYDTLFFERKTGLKPATPSLEG